MRRTGVASFLAILVLGAGAASALAVSGAGLPAWDTVPAASPRADASLLDVAAVPGGAVWAVGHAGTRPLAERFDGTSFSRVRVGGVAGRANVLEGVDGTGPADVWAVGHADRTDFGGSLSLTYRWNGSAWTRVPSPNAGNSEAQNNLMAVAPVSPSDAWAVGQFVDV